MNELVSIVVPVYNMGSNIESCVASLQKQDYPNIEIILVDDGSEDDSYARCCAIAEKGSQIVVYHTENHGSGPARNYGIKHAKGRYIYFPDADDYLEPNAITSMVKAMDGGKYDLVVFGFKYINQNGKLIKTKSYEESSQCGNDIRKSYKEYMMTMSRWGIQGAPWNKFFDVEVIKKYGIEYPPLRRHQDEGFIGRYMCYTTSVHFISNVLYTYHVNDLKREWQKYPVDYIDAVIGLYQIRKRTILTWNPMDKDTHDLITREYITNVIKALELAFSPKMRFSSKSDRLSWIKQSLEKANICAYQMPHAFDMPYQEKILCIIKKQKYNKIYNTFRIKVFVERYFQGVFKAIKKHKLL